MKGYKAFIRESYVTSVLDNKSNYYEIFNMPTNNELMDIKNQGLFNVCRFIAINNDFYVFSSELLHSKAILQLGLNVNYNTTKLNEMFSGNARILFNYKLEFIGANQTQDIKKAKKVYPQIKSYF